MSVCNALKGIKVHGFSDAGVTALWHRWRAVVRMGPTGPVTSLEPWTHWISPDLHGFYKWTMDTFSEIVLKVVHHRQTGRLKAWSNWIRRDLTSHPYQWLRPEFVPAAPYLVCKPKTLPMGLGYWSNQLFLMPTFGRHGCLIFVEMGTLLSPLRPFLILLGIIFHRRPFWIFPFLLVRSFLKLPWPRNPLLGVLIAGLGMRLKLFSLSWFFGLASVLRQIEAAGRWPQGLLDAYIAMIPKAEGDSTPLGQRPLCVFLVVYRLWASVRLAHLQEWFYSWVPDSVFSAGKGVSSVDAWYTTSIDMKRFLATLARMISIFLLLMLSNLLTRLIGTFLTVPWGDLAFLPVFVRFTSLFTGNGYGLSLLLGWKRLGHGIGASPKVAHSV